jgi:uncharacterized protein
MKKLTFAAIILVVIGAANWGLVGLGYFFGTNLNIVNLLLGKWPILENLVYLLVGIAGAVKCWACSNEKCSCHSS